jgi:transposase InsO family protein
MREHGLVACQPRPYKRTTYGDRAGAAPDLLDRDFSAALPRHRLVGDITYVWTWEGWLYLATVIDCFSRQVVGWSMAEHMRAELVVDALTTAAGNGSLDRRRYFIPIAAASILQRGSAPRWMGTGCGSRWAEPGCVS